MSDTNPHIDRLRATLARDPRGDVDGGAWDEWDADVSAVEALAAELDAAKREREQAMDMLNRVRQVHDAEVRRKVEAYDAAHYEVKRNPKSRAELVMRAERAEAALAETAQKHHRDLIALREAEAALAEAQRERDDALTAMQAAWDDTNRALAALDAARKALRDDAIYIAAMRARRHGTATGDDCVLCKSDQRELDRIGAALAADAADTEPKRKWSDACPCCKGYPGYDTCTCPAPAAEEE